MKIDETKLQQVRRIKPTRRSVSGVYMFRGEVAVEFESTLERDFILRTEFSLSVLEIVPQPCRIEYLAPSCRKQTYTPDFLVYYRLGNRSFEDYQKPVLVEVKPEAEWRQHWRKWLPKWKAAHAYARQQGWEFHIRDESRIRDQALKNINFLARYKRMTFPPEESRVVIETAKQMGTVTVDYLLARHFMGLYRAQGIAHIWHLLAIRALDCDISRPLSNFTELWVPNDE